ncbi:hypothetical protein [Streptomyces cinereoruber]
MVETREPVRPLDVAAASVLVALYRLVLAEAEEQRESGGRAGPSIGSWPGGGPWESEVMVRLAWDISAELAEKPKRCDETAVEEVVRVVTGWVTGPDRYVEVAATLAGEFSAVADRADDWEAVADRYLQRHQRVVHPDHVVERVQNYLVSQSRAGSAR